MITLQYPNDYIDDLFITLEFLKSDRSDITQLRANGITLQLLEMEIKDLEQEIIKELITNTKITIT